MTPELAYFLKINIAIALFYAFYRLFFYRDTFFQWRRTALLCFLVISPLYPVLNIQEWIRSHEPMVAMVDLYATIVLPEIEITPEVRAADWQSIILCLRIRNFACETVLPLNSPRMCVLSSLRNSLSRWLLLIIS